MFLFTGNLVAEPQTILVLGDSLSAAYRIPLTSGWTQQLQQRLQNEHKPVQIVNASIAGMTSAEGLQRLPDLLQRHQPCALILELGANDGLRGLNLQSMRANLAAMIELAQAQEVAVLLVGMRIPPNYGKAYADAFQLTFTQLAKQYQLAFLPFLLDKVAGDPRYMQSDGLHPNAAAQPLIVENLWDLVVAMLKPTPVTRQ